MSVLVVSGSKLGSVANMFIIDNSPKRCRNVMMEDFVHDYYSIGMFKKTYARRIEFICSKDKWPEVDLPFQVGAPLQKKGCEKANKK
jgi:hypothetical protein